MFRQLVGLILKRIELVRPIFDFSKDDEDMNDDDDDEEGASSIFYNDLYKLDLTTQKWSPLHLRYSFEMILVHNKRIYIC